MITDLLELMEVIEDPRQESKIRHKMKDIIFIDLLATLGNADKWEEKEGFAITHENFLRQYLELPNGIPLHDTMRRTMGMIRTEQLTKLVAKWKELLNQDEGEELKKIICVDGKTMRGNRSENKKPNHVVSAWCKEDGYCLGQATVSEKSNEITAIPQVLNNIEIKGQIVTIDAMGTQTDIADIIQSRRADYVLALKKNQTTLYEDVHLFLSDEEELNRLKTPENYTKTIEKAHGQTEKREYYQTDFIAWLSQKKKWKGLKSIGMEIKTITKKDGQVFQEKRLFIASLPVDIALFKRAVRGHWAIESMHWHLDVTFREDANTTLDKIASQNQNVIRKWCISILNLLEIGRKKASAKLKRYYIAMNPAFYLGRVLGL